MVSREVFRDGFRVVFREVFREVITAVLLAFQCVTNITLWYVRNGQWSK